MPRPGAGWDASPDEAGQQGRRRRVVFTGRHERQLDAKGRVALPADLRREFGDSCFLALGESGCVDLFTPEEFEKMAEELKEKRSRGEISTDRFRTVMHFAFRTPIDGQGRVNVDPTLRQLAELEVGTKVIVAGAYDRLEIWNPQRLTQVSERGVATILQR